MDKYWRYSDCHIRHSGTAIMALGGATGHVWTPIAMCQDKDVAERLAASVRASPEAMVIALEHSRVGWLNAIEMGLLPDQHHGVARIIIDQITSALTKANPDA